MPLGLDNIFGIHEHAVALRSRRAEILATNLSNADTPNFKARDIDFADTLAEAQATAKGSELTLSDERHIPSSSTTSGLATGVRYRTPLQPSVDGNTVDTATEQSKFLDNAMRYQASLTFLSGSVRSLLTAIREE